jgi:hypothetical protein
MKRVLWSVLTVGALFAGLAHANTDPSASTTRSDDSSGLAVCIDPKAIPPPPSNVAPACNPGPCDACDAAFDACLDSCGGNAQCERNCASRYSFCIRCCTP